MTPCLSTITVALALFHLELAAPVAPPPPSKDFVNGFEQGVRYGLIMGRLNPTEDSIPWLTKEAKKWYWLMVVDEGKTLIKMAETNNAAITPAEQDARRLSTLAITDPAAYQAELRARGLWPVDLDEYLKRDRSKDPGASPTP